ncbi:DUF3576 domain-containing protein [Acidocella facilis]|uniref:DUF3576 domain-containing protein n=1 Tax=Acidocella facilis TaxID=525 RepID=UPI00047E1293|nr:DUF3576 domain-containing protein [Acidocella facilis]
MRIIQRVAVPASLALSLLGLSACSGGLKTSNPDVANYEMGGMGPAAPGSGSLFTLGKGSTGGAASNTNIQVNAYLWRATLDTLSFMPLVSADPFGGVIITDWYTPPGQPGTRFKANAYILSKTLTADAIQVSVFEQVQQNGQWVDSSADPSLASGLEDRILARAADLQAAAKNTK